MQASKKRNEEVIGFFFCRRHKLTKHHSRYLPQAWAVPGPDCYEYQTAGGLVLKQQFHLYLLETYLKQGLDVIHVHTHPGRSAPHFSSIDDSHESEYARFLSTAIKRKPRLISGIFDESLHRHNFRLWNRKGTDVKPVEFYHSWFEVAEPVEIFEAIALAYEQFGPSAEEIFDHLPIEAAKDLIDFLMGQFVADTLTRSQRKEIDAYYRDLKLATG